MSIILANDSRELAINEQPAASLFNEDPVTRLRKDWLAGKSEKTQQTYINSVDCFAKYLQNEPALIAGLEVDNWLDALKVFLSILDHRTAYELARRYQQAMLADGKSPATVNLRVAALRSASKSAHRLGLSQWQLSCPNVKRTGPSRSTRGMGTDNCLAVIKMAKAHKNPAKGSRDAAIFSCLLTLGLRRSELVELRLSDVTLNEGIADLDANPPALRLRNAKGHSDSIVTITLPLATRQALLVWLEHRGREEGPLFTRLDSRRDKSQLQRLSGSGLFYLCRAYGAKVGQKTARIHGWRHDACSEAIRQCSDITTVLSFSRHSNIETLLLYRDAEAQEAAKISNGLAALI